MDRQYKNKLNLLYQAWPEGTVAVQSWLNGKEIYRQLSNSYCKGGYIRKIGHGAFVKLNDKVDWMGALYAIQEQMGLPVHVGGKSALQMRKLAHHLPLGGRAIVSLFGDPSCKLPKWFTSYDWGVDIQYSAVRIFKQDQSLGLEREEVGNYSTLVSSPERAILELLHFVPQDESFEEARQLMENLTTLRPHLVQRLLEGCSFVKVSRLFMFLAEECGHPWIKDIDTKLVNFGKGKRIIAKGGRLDPIYNITVPNDIFYFPARQMKVLLNKHNKSPAVRLMCPTSEQTLVYGKEHGCFASVVYLTDLNNSLPVLDGLLKEFKIEKRGSRDLKKRLRESWLPKVPSNIANSDIRSINKESNNPLSALVELVVADHLKHDGYEILDLAVWKEWRYNEYRRRQYKKVPDVCCSKGGRTLNIEVKYIDMSQEFQKNVIEQLKTGESEAYWMDERASVNYFFGRIAEAVLQLQDLSRDSRQVWLVFHGISSHERHVFEKSYLKNPPQWFVDTDKQKKALELESFKKVGIENRSPADWLKEVPCLVIATLKDWRLENVCVHETEKLLE